MSRQGQHAILYAALLLVAALVAGCGTTVEAGSKLTVYVSVPRAGAERLVGRDTLVGVRDALRDGG